MDGHGTPVQQLPGTLLLGSAGDIQHHVHPGLWIDDVRSVVTLCSYF